MLHDIAMFCFWALIPPATGLVVRRWSPALRIPEVFFRGWAFGAGIDTVVLMFGQDWAAVSGSAVSAVAALVLWWWSRRRRKRVPRQFGAKARALRDVLVRKARDAARPRPVPRLVPQCAASAPVFPASRLSPYM